MPDTPDSLSFRDDEAGTDDGLRLPGGRLISWQRAALILIAVLTLFRFWYCQTIELVGDEAYYRLWAQHLDLSYFSKGPGVAYTIALGIKLLGDSVLGVRFFAILLSAGTGFGIFQLGRKLFSGRIGFYGMVLAGVVPMFCAGSVLMTIDPLSVFFWTMAAITFWRAKDEDGPSWWLLTGLLIGLGMLCKFTNVAELICFALFCVFSPGHRRQLRQKTFWLMLLVAVLCLIPVVVWNEKNGWITFQHLQHRGALDRHWRFSAWELWKFIQNQAVFISPLIFIGILAAGIGGFVQAVKKRAETPVLFLLCLFWPLFLFYLVLGLNEAGQANWTCPSYIGGFILAAVIWSRWVRQSEVLRWTAIVSLVVAVLMTIVAHDTFWLNMPPKRDPLNRVRGSADLSRQVYQQQKEHGAAFIIAGNYSYASLIAFYHPEHPQTYIPRHEGIENQFSFWPDYSDGFTGESAIFVTDSDEAPPSQLRREFASVQLIKETWTSHRGRLVRKFYFYLCRDFGGLSESTESKP